MIMTMIIIIIMIMMIRKYAFIKKYYALIGSRAR